MSGDRSSAFPVRTFWRGTTVGTLGSPVRVGVGLDGWARVEAGWQVGWWVGAEDRWHLPEHEVAVRQRLVGEAPVVETAMRIPGGDALQRVFAVAGVGDLGPLLVMEVENASAVPVAVAIVVTGLDDRLTVERHPTAATRASVHFRHLSPGDGEYATVHDLLFDRAPADVAVGRGVATFIFPVPHTATLRIGIPLEDGVPVEHGASSVPDRSPGLPSAVPAATAVAKGWEAQGGRGARVELPDPTITATLDAARRQLLLAELGGGELIGGIGHGRAPGLDWVETAVITRAFDRLGFWPESERVLLALPERLGDEGAVDAEGRVDTAGAALVALDHHLATTGNDELARAMVEVVFAIALGLRRRALPGRRWGRARAPAPLPARAPGGADGEAGWWAWWWVVAGFEAAARVLVRAGEDAAAEQAVLDAAAARAEVLPRLPASGICAAAIDGPPSGAAWVNLLAGQALPAPDRAGWWEATRTWLAEHATDPEGRILADGGDLVRPLASLVVAAADIRAGDARGLDRLLTLAGDAGDLRVWPEQYRVPSGAAGKGRSPDPTATAAFVDAALDLLLHAAPDGGLVLAPVVPETWLGQGWEVHEAPTPHGRCSYAVRWHGERPALLWQLEDRGTGGPAPRLTVPGLDPDWSTTEPRGEALLAVPPAARLPLGRVGFDLEADRPAPGPGVAPGRPPATGGDGRARPSDGGERPIDGGSFT
jgi:hypothetical protein